MTTRAVEKLIERYVDGVRLPGDHTYFYPGPRDAITLICISRSIQRGVFYE